VAKTTLPEINKDKKNISGDVNMNKILKYLAISVILVLIAGCVGQRPEQTPTPTPTPTTQPTITQTKEEVIKGEIKTIGDGYAYSWIKIEGDKPTAIGVVFNEGILKNLSTYDTEFILSLPDLRLADMQDTVFNHIGINWNPKGHIPSGVYGVPHFDFHFYMIDQQYRNNITDIKLMEKNVSSEYIPSGYVSTPGGVPKMGAHWIDPTSPEFNNQTFTKTFIYGFYDGKMIFLEPMITMTYLETKPNTIEDIKLPTKYVGPGYYPTKYSINYNDKTNEYTVSLEEMVYRS
jgi:hypothetical protein